MPPHRDMLDMKSGVGGRYDVKCSAKVGGGGAGVDAVGDNNVVVEVEK